jgi:hypothetical protein
LAFIHVIVALQAWRMQKLQGHGGFSLDFQGKFRRPSHMWLAQSPCKQPLWGQCMKLQRWSLSYNG